MKKTWLDNLIGFTLAIMCLLTIVQCGNSNNTKRTLIFKTTPNPSIVIESDYVHTYSDSNGVIQKETFKGPWTYWNFTVSNTTSATITVYAIHYIGRAMTEDFDGDVIPGKDENVLFTLAPEETITGKSIIHDLPERNQLNALNYYFNAKAIGWYGDADNPEKSFKSSFSFRATE